MATNSLDLHSLDSVPGTYQIIADEETLIHSIRGANPNAEIKRHKNIILVPQPTNSPNDPLNWSPFRKYWHMILVCIVTGFTAATSNDAGSAQASMNQELGISWNAMNTAAGVLFVGVAAMSFLLSPSSFLYGRKIAYLICILVGLGGAIWFIFVQTASDSVWNQLFVGASEAAAEAQVQLSLSDIFFQHQIGFAISLYIMATSIGTFLGPLVSGYLAGGPGWRWIPRWGAILSAVLFVLLLIGLEETYFDRDSYSQRGRTAVATEKSEGTVTTVVDSNSDSEPRKPYLKSISPITFATNLRGTGFKQYMQRLWLQCRVFLFLPVLYSGLMWGTQDIFLTFYLTTMAEDWSSPPYNYSNAAIGLMNVPLLIGSILGCIYGGHFSDKFVLYYASRFNHGLFEPEARLYLLLPTGIISPVGLFMFGIGTAHQWPWIASYIGLGFIGFGFGCAGDLSMSYLIDAYPEMVLEGMVGVAVVNNTLACIFTFSCQSWINHQGTFKTYIALGVISFCIFMTTVPMIIYGKSCRRKTKRMYLEFLRRRDGFK